MHNFIFLLLFLSLPLFSDPEVLTYAGMTIECDQGCGQVDDPDVEDIARIFKKTISRVFRKCDALDESLRGVTINPWNVEDFECSAWDWRTSHGLWPAKGALGELTKEPPQILYTVDTYPQFLETISAMREDVYFFYQQSPRLEIDSYKSLVLSLKRIDQSRYDSVDIYDGGKLELYEYGEINGTAKKIPSLISHLENVIQKDEEDPYYWETQYEKKRTIVEQASEKIDSLFKRMFTWCLENHQVEGLAFNAALEHFIAGDYDKALEQIQFLIDLCEKQKSADDLVSKLYLLQGQVHSEFCVYSDAIVSLTTAIQKNPSLKEAYFERAAVYFELGEFDKALTDYLESDYQNTAPENKIQWAAIPQVSAGITAGIAIGSSQSAVEFVPETLSTLRGLGNGLWALCSDPIGASKAFTTAAIQCVEYIKTHSTFQLAQDMVPELKELVQNYDQFSDFEKGKLIGRVIGKYGTNILICKYSMTGLKAYNELKKANKAMTLEALASPKNSQKILEDAGKWGQNRKNQTSKILIEKDKHSKHNTSAHNFEPFDKKTGLRKSTWNEEVDPQVLLDNFAGKGRKAGTIEGAPGVPGYKEKTNFGIVIGSYFDKNGKEIKTTWGIIHYSKKGAHIVPHPPDIIKK